MLLQLYLRMERLLDGSANLLVDQDSERELLFMHQLQLLDSLAHGVFLRSSPCRATGWWFPNRKNAPFSFSTSPGTRPERIPEGDLCHTHAPTGDGLLRQPS